MSESHFGFSDVNGANIYSPLGIAAQKSPLFASLPGASKALPNPDSAKLLAPNDTPNLISWSQLGGEGRSQAPYADAWNKIAVPHAADNPFGPEADHAEIARGDKAWLQSYRASAENTEKGAANAVAQGDIKRARLIERGADENARSMEKFRPDSTRTLGVKPAPYQSYGAFIEQNAPRDHQAFLYENALGKFKAATSIVDDAKANAPWSARAADALKTHFANMTNFFGSLFTRTSAA